jgi:hypothetical protein
MPLGEIRVGPNDKKTRGIAQDVQVNFLGYPRGMPSEHVMHVIVATDFSRLPRHGSGHSLTIIAPFHGASFQHVQVVPEIMSDPIFTDHQKYRSGHEAKDTEDHFAEGGVVPEVGPEIFMVQCSFSKRILHSRLP